MAEEERSFIENVGGLFGRGLEAGVDALAERVPLAGRPIQAMFNTEGYQDIQAEREARQNRRELLALQTAQAKIEAARDPERYQREVAKDELAMAATRQGMDIQAQDAAHRQAMYPHQEQTAAMQTQAARDAADESAYQKYMVDGGRQLTAQLQGSGLDNTEIASYINTPQVRAKLQMGWYLDKARRAFGENDPEAMKYLQDSLAGQGWSLNVDKDGMPWLDMGNGMRRPATVDGIKALMGEINQGAIDEFNARSKYSNTKLNGDPALMVLGDRIRKASLFTDGSYSAAEKAFSGIFSNADNAQKQVALVHQGLNMLQRNEIDAATLFSMLTSKPTNKETGEQGLSILEQMGYRWQGTDPSNFLLTNNTTKQTYTLAGFADMIAKQDTLGADLDRKIGEMQTRYVMNTRIANAAAAKSIVDDLNGGEGKNGKSGKSSSKSSSKGDDAEIPMEEVDPRFVDMEGKPFSPKVRSVMFDADTFYRDRMGTDWDTLDDEDQRDVMYAFAKTVDRAKKAKGDLKYDDFKKFNDFFKNQLPDRLKDKVAAPFAEQIEEEEKRRKEEEAKNSKKVLLQGADKRDFVYVTPFGGIGTISNSRKK